MRNRGGACPGVWPRKRAIRQASPKASLRHDGKRSGPVAQDGLPGPAGRSKKLLMVSTRSSLGRSMGWLRRTRASPRPGPLLGPPAGPELLDHRGGPVTPVPRRARSRVSGLGAHRRPLVCSGSRSPSSARVQASVRKSFAPRRWEAFWTDRWSPAASPWRPARKGSGADGGKHFGTLAAPPASRSSKQCTAAGPRR